MKRALLFIALLLSVAMYAAKEDTYVLYTGFEGGAIPEGWTQEKVVGDRLFTVEKGDQAINPEGAYAGDYRLLIRNESGQTDHAVTRLYTPVIKDLDLQTLPMILIISHAQMHWTGDVDVLRIYYRNSTDANAKWIPVEEGEFLTKIQGWQTDTLYLTGTNTAEYQLCFEVTDNMGKGVVIDEIIVRPEPQCFTPVISINGLTGQAANIGWTGSLDAEQFHFILAKEEAEDPEKIEEPLVNTMLDGMVLSYETGKTLETNTDYYVYIKSICANEETEWAASKFTTKSYFELPYSENFNMVPATNSPMIKYWTRGTNVFAQDTKPMEIPYVNCAKGVDYLYRYSVTSTTCLAFTAGNSEFNDDTAFPANQYAYAATPELGIDNIQNIEVTFWGTANNGAGLINAIIVGAMSDPENYKTFVPADTIYLTSFNCIENHTVYFDKVAANPDLKYIAFASDFDQANLFYIDDVVVKQAAAVKRPSDVKLTNIHANGVTVNANLRGATKCNIVATNVVLDLNDNPIVDLEKIDAKDIIKTVEGVTLPYEFKFDTDLKGAFVELYVVGVNGDAKSQSSAPVKMHLPLKMTGTYLYADFDEYDNGYPYWHAADAYNYYRNGDAYAPTSGRPYTATMYYGTNYITMPNSLEEWPITQSNYGHNTTNAFTLQVSGRKADDGTEYYLPGFAQYMALGEVDSTSNLTMSYYVSVTSLNRKSGTRGGVPATYAIGMMTDPFDITTFDTIQVITTTAAMRNMKYMEHNLSTYKGAGRYPAIMAVAGATPGHDSYGNPMYSQVYIDEFMVATPDKCMAPKNVRVSNVTSEGADITWDKGNMVKWEVLVGTEFITEIDRMTYTEVIVGVVDTLLIDTVDVPSYTIKGLKPDTQYGVLVSTVCTLDGGTEMGDAVNFLTTCAPSVEVPFYENFDARTSKPQCWRAVGAGNVSSISIGKENSTRWQLSPSAMNKLCYVELPMMNTPLNQLQISFDLGVTVPDYVGAPVHVVVMDSAANMDTVKTFVVKKSGELQHYIASFRNYKGNGQFIALVRDSAYTSTFSSNLGRETGYEIWLDNVAVELLPPCEMITGTNVFNPSTSGAIVEWNTGDASEWEVAVTTSAVDLSEESSSSAIVKILSAKEMPFTFSGVCEPGTDYYVAVRSVCDANTKGFWSEYASFQTLCLPTTPEALGVVDFADKNTLKCWTVGSRSGNEEPTCANGYLQISNKAGAAYDGGFAFMPMMDVDDISKYQVSFVAHGGTNLGSLHTLSVGIASNPAEEMTVVQTLDLNIVTKENAFKEGRRYVVRFNPYKGDGEGKKGKYIGFMSNSGDKANDIFIDDIQVSLIPECWEPSIFEIESMTNSSVTLKWENVEETSYELIIKKANGTLFSVDTITPVVDPETLYITHTVNGLAGVTTYKAYLHSICASGNSADAPVITFSTDCPDVMPLPYEECFDYSIIATAAPFTGINCWQTWTQQKDTIFTEGTAAGQYGYVSNKAAKSSLGGLYIGSSFGNASNKPVTTYAVLPTFGKSVKNLMLSFDYNKATYSYTGKIAIGAATTIDTITDLVASITWIDTVDLVKEAYNSAGYPWYHYSNALDSYTGDGEYLVLAAVQGTGSSSTTINYLYIDNVFVEDIPTCFRPMNVTGTSATATSLSFTWDNAGEETQWDVTCVPADGDIDPTNIKTVNVKEATIEDLIPSSDYDVYVRANCGNGDVSSWSHVLTLSTLCRTDVSGMLYNFDDPDDRIPNLYPKQYSESSYPDWDGCWMQGAPFEPTNKTYYNSAVPRMTGTYQKTYALYAISDLYAIELGTETPNNYDGGYMVSPEVAGNLDDMQVSFWMRAGYTKIADGSNYTSYSADGYARSIKVGTMTDPSDFSTFELLADVQTAKMEVAPDPEGLEYWRQFNIPLYQAQGKFVVFLSKYAPAKNIVYIDDIEFGAVKGVPMPTAVKSDYDKLAYNHIELVWKSAMQKFRVKVSSNGVNLKEETITGEPRYIADGLTESTEYTFTVVAINEAGEESVPVTVTVATPCIPTDQYGAYWDMQSNLEQFGATDAYMMPSCWTVGCLTNNFTDSYKPVAKANTATILYSHGEGTGSSERSLYFASSSMANGLYAIMPELDVDMEGMVLEFYMRNGYVNASTGKFSVANSSYNDQSRSIVVGYIVNDDISTFKAVATEKYNQTVTTAIVATADPDQYWQRVRIPLTHFADDVNKYRIAFMYNQGNAVSAYMCIDDISLVSEEGCPGISGFSVTRKATTATFSWKTEATSSRVQVATDNEFENIVINEIVEGTTSYTATGLAQGTTYYVRVQSYCSATDASAFATGVFSTYCAPRYFEDFSCDRIMPENWIRGGDANSTDIAVYSGAKIKTDGISDTRADIWQRDYDRNDVYVVNINENNYAYNWWLISPEFDLTDYANDSILFSLDLALESNQHGDPNPVGENDVLSINVSLDGGDNWFAEDMICKWQNKKGSNYSYNSLKKTPTRFYIDITKYAGKKITFGFYSSTIKNDTVTAMINYLRMDNIQVNTFNTKIDKQTACQWEDFQDEYFTVFGDDAKVGMNTAEKYSLSTEDGVSDKLVKLQLTVTPAATTNQNYRICEGDDYTNDNFNIKNVTSSNIYKQKLGGTSTCDSLVVLDLSVIPTQTGDVEATICSGTYYEFGGEKYYTSQPNLTKTFKSVEGCDSIVTLHLTVNPIIEGEMQEIYLCEGSEYILGTQTITEAGEYTETLSTENSCDSIAKVKVIMAPVYNTSIRTAICHGSKYPYAPFENMSVQGTYKSESTSQYGCDSTITLRLLVADIDNVIYDTIAETDLPYMVNDSVILPVGTARGSHDATITLDCGVTNMVIQVGESVGLGKIESNTLNVPNPVMVGQDITVLTDFSAAQLRDMTLEVFSSAGMLVYRATPKVTPIVIPGMLAAGMYDVRITTSESVYNAKLIVR